MKPWLNLNQCFGEDLVKTLKDLTTTCRVLGSMYEAESIKGHYVKSKDGFLIFPKNGDRSIKTYLWIPKDDIIIGTDPSGLPELLVLNRFESNVSKKGAQYFLPSSIASLEFSCFIEVGNSDISYSDISLYESIAPKGGRISFIKTGYAGAYESRAVETVFGM